MSPLNKGLIFTAALLSAGCASLVAPAPSAERSALRAGQYALDPAHASILFKIDHLGFSTYVGRFETFDAALDFDADDPTAAQIDATIEIESLDIANDDFAATLAGPDWFDASAFPEARFRSTAIEITGDNTGRMTGDFTLKGVTAPITLDVIFNGGDRDLLRGAYVVGFSATGSFDRTVFGVDRFAGVVGNDVFIEIEAEFERR
ncbi:MAG: YceI family protein [Pseudomonadota bacterium]